MSNSIVITETYAKTDNGGNNMAKYHFIFNAQSSSMALTTVTTAATIAIETFNQTSSNVVEHKIGGNISEWFTTDYSIVPVDATTNSFLYGFFLTILFLFILIVVAAICCVCYLSKFANTETATPSNKSVQQIGNEKVHQCSNNSYECILNKQTAIVLSPVEDGQRMKQTTKYANDQLSINDDSNALFKVVDNNESGVLYYSSLYSEPKFIRKSYQPTTSTSYSSVSPGLCHDYKNKVQKAKRKQTNIEWNGSDFDHQKLQSRRTLQTNFTTVSQYMNRQKDQLKVQRTITYFNSLSCFQFKPIINQSQQIESYVDIVRTNESGVCSSDLGMIGGRQVIHLAEDCCPSFLGPLCHVLIHEIFHTVGFFHEQSRPDRNEYVWINYSNIKNDKHYNYQREWGNIPNMIGNYDYYSIMHYRLNDFAIEPPIPTMIALRLTSTNKQFVGQLVSVTSGDVLRLNQANHCIIENYQCTDPSGHNLKNNRLFVPGDILTYQCPKNHLIIGSISRRCLHGCQWTGVEPKCVARSVINKLGPFAYCNFEEECLLFLQYNQFIQVLPIKNTLITEVDYDVTFGNASGHVLSVPNWTHLSSSRIQTKQFSINCPQVNAKNEIYFCISYGYYMQSHLSSNDLFKLRLYSTIERNGNISDTLHWESAADLNEELWNRWHFTSQKIQSHCDTYESKISFSWDIFQTNGTFHTNKDIVLEQTFALDEISIKMCNDKSCQC